MQALVFDGSFRLVRDRPEPRPAAGEVLLRVRLAGICATDLEIARGYLSFRGVPGHEFVGAVVDGPPALRGRRVVAEINCVCGSCDMCSRGLASHCRRRTVVGIAGRDGAFAECLAVPAANCHVLPDELTDEQAVLVEPLAAAFQVLRQVPIDKRSRVTVLGSGRLGLLVAQVLARTRCTLVVVGRNPRTLELLDRRSIRTRHVSELGSARDQDVVVECTGSPDGLGMALRLARPRGTIVMKTTCAAPLSLDLAPLVVDEITLLGSRCGPFSDAISALARGEIDVSPFLTDIRPLSAGVEAMQAAASPDVLKILLRPGT